jgi:hypothetical protein
MKTRRRWTEAEIELVMARYADTNTAELAAMLGRPEGSVYTLAHYRGLHKSAEFMRERHGAHAVEVGRGTRFQPGQVSWNKGLSYQPGGRSPETQFQVGHRPHRWVPIGSYRINADGYLDRKVTDDGRGARDWCAVHRLLWIEAHGTPPPGHVIVFRPGMRTTDLAAITLDVLELVTRAELMRRNSIERYPKEISDLMRLRGVVNRQINRARKTA